MKKNPQDIELLKVAVGEKYNRPIGTVGECKLLAEEITKCVPNEQISTKTVQRLWQQKHTNLSLAILNVLAKISWLYELFRSHRRLERKKRTEQIFQSFAVGWKIQATRCNDHRFKPKQLRNVTRILG